MVRFVAGCLVALCCACLCTEVLQGEDVPAPAEQKFAPVQDKLPVAPPKDAIVLLDAEGKNLFLSKEGKPADWTMAGGVLTAKRGGGRANHIVSPWHFRDADIHVEFQTAPQSGGNSGVYIHGNYELQIFNSHGKEKPDQGDAGAVYGFAPPLVNAAKKPGEWQVYDIRYRAPRRGLDGKIVQPGLITAWLNGQKVQENTEVGEPRSNYHPFRYKSTPYLQEIWQRQLQTGIGPVFLQDHDSPTQFRNVWIRPLDGHAFLYQPPKDANADDVFAGQGIMVGEVTPNSALVQVRLTKSDKPEAGDLIGTPGVVKFSLLPADDKQGEEPQVQEIAAAAEHDFIARASFPKLKPGTTYVCRTQIGPAADKLKPGPVAHFQTLPGAKLAEKVSFVVVTGMNFAKFHGDPRIDRAQHLIENNINLPPAYAGPDKALGYPALATILKLKPNFFVGTGDNVYYDTPDKPRAETVAELRQKWHEQFAQPRFRDLFAAVPTYWEIDDHDYRIDDGDNSGDYDPTPEVGRRMMLEQLPVAPIQDQSAKTYRTHRVSKDLQIWLVENRMYRSPNALPDGPGKTIWGKEQREWLQRTLTESDATFKVLISPNPMVGPDDARKTDNHTNIGGFQHERDSFFAWLKQQGLDEQGFYLICGDRHWQYHAVHPTGIEEFSCGALVDANSRLGRKPGDPKSTDPDAKIQQAYTQDEPSGGFLYVQSTPSGGGRGASLSFVFYDEQGKVLYQHMK